MTEYIDVFFRYGMLIFLIYIVIVFFNIAFWLFIIKKIIKSIKRSTSKKYFKNNIINNKINPNYTKYSRVYNDVSKKELQKLNIDDINILKDYYYGMFLDFENAYNNLDYNSMKLLSTKQLYQKYYTGIKLDLEVGQKRIIKDITRKNVIVFELDSTIAKQIATVMIEISYITYKMDKNGKIISGSNTVPINEKFEVAFRKDFESNEITICKNCGAEVNGKKCKYCRTSVKDVEFKISSIKKIIN